MLRKYVKSLVPPPVRFALRELALEVRLARLHRAASRKARRYRVDGELLKVNLASGFHPKPGCDQRGPVRVHRRSAPRLAQAAAFSGQLRALHLCRAFFRASRISERGRDNRLGSRGRRHGVPGVAISAGVQTGAGAGWRAGHRRPGRGRDDRRVQSTGTKRPLRWSSGGDPSGATPRCTGSIISFARDANTSTPTMKKRWRRCFDHPCSAT